MHKRKHKRSHREDDCSAESSDTPAPDPCLYIQAYEADVIHGPSAASARLLECPDPSVTTSADANPRSGLIRWGLSVGLSDADTRQSDQPALWVDRSQKEFDIRLLLDHLPNFQSEHTGARPISPSGWSDLPSDSEDTFFFSPDELDDYRREKRRKLIDRGREERLRALATTDDRENDPDPWGGSDEEPDEAQRELIRKTASHVISSPNPAQLEMRILANYGTDKRFAFLRGRWSRVWRTEKERVKQRQAEEAKKTHPSTVLASLGGLADYGDSDTDGEESSDKQTEEPESVTDTARTNDVHSSEEAVREARRARAKEWTARRRAEQAGESPAKRI